LYTILAVLCSYALICTNAVGVSTVTAAVLYRSNTLALLLNNSCTVDIHDHHADRLDDNATRDWKKSMRGQWRGEKSKDNDIDDLFETRVFYIIQTI